MAFVDKTKVYIRSGNGGHGCLSFRREKYVEYGGPDGGNGGKGGDVIIQGQRNISSLIYYRYNQHQKAGNGQPGSGRLKTGLSGKDLILKVPCGTEIYNEEENVKLHEIIKDEEKFYFLRGGTGGKGNAHFKSSVNQAPRKFQKGEEGKEATIIFKLKILADVGLIGMPNAGKSSILSISTNAKPKIGDYPFTTIHPNIGVVKFDDSDFILADIPGLIEDASQGKGLGHDFLSHIERCKILLHIIDGFEGNIIEKYHTIRKELQKYGQGTSEKEEIIVINKIDLMNKDNLDYEKLFPNIKVFPISAATNQGINKLMKYCLQRVYEK